MKTKTPLTTAERQQRAKAKQLALGRVRRPVSATPAEHEQVQALLAKLRSEPILEQKKALTLAQQALVFCSYLYGDEFTINYNTLLSVCDISAERFDEGDDSSCWKFKDNSELSWCGDHVTTFPL